MACSSSSSSSFSLRSHDSRAFPPGPLAAGGLAVAFGVVAYELTRGASFVPPKLALVAFGLLDAAAAPFVRTPRVANAVAWSIPLVGAPLGVSPLQALSKASFAGATPMEVFIEHALITTMAAILAEAADG